MRALVKDLFRRKARSVLTIVGIALGVFALVSLGAAAEESYTYIGSLRAYYANTIVIVDERDESTLGMTGGYHPIDRERLEEIGRVPGVATAGGTSVLLLEPDAPPIGVPPMILGGMFPPERYTRGLWAVQEGRRFSEEETGVAVVGIDLARQKNTRVGENMTIRHRDFEVVGILDRTFISVSDSAVFVPLAQAREMYLEEMPVPFQSISDPEDLHYQAGAIVEDGADPVEVARLIERDVEGVAALDPDELMALADTLTVLLWAVVGAVGALALLIGGLTIVNTMTMSVVERTREIGTKRALGASAWRVSRDVLAESSAMGLIGGVVGVAVGALVTSVLNDALTAQTGMSLFLVTWRLCLGSLVFAVLLGGLGGAYPAVHAARMDPVEALAYE